MRHFSLFDGMDDGMKKQAADDQFYTIDLGTESALLGLFDVLGWVSRNVKPGDPEGPDPQVIRELTDYVNDLYSSEDFVLRVDFGQLEQIRQAFDAFMGYAGQFEDREEFESLNSDVKVDDILEAEEVLDAATAATMDPSSNKGLEDIPTMEKNPEDLAEGEIPVNVKETCPSCGGVNTFSTVDEFGEVRCDNCGALDPRDAEWENPIPEGPSPVAPVTPAAKNKAQACPICGQNTINPKTNQCTACEWDGDNACPECKNDQSLQSDENGYRSCTNCGWMEENIQQRVELENQYELPAVEHPLGPHTGAEESIDLYGTGNCESCGAALGEDGTCKNWMVHQSESHPCPQCGIPFDTFYCPNCNYFRSSWPGKKDNSAEQLQQAFDAPTTEHPLGDHVGANEEGLPEEPEREFYTSGRFVNTNPDRFGPKQWGVIVDPASGQRPPEPGDWAEITQKTKSYARPVPITLVDQVGSQSWTFKNGHHPSI